jgi:hypothetical protein
VGSNRQTFGEAGSVGNRLIQTVASEDYLVVGIVDDQLMSHREPSVTTVLEEEEYGPKRRTIQQSSGKRRKYQDT